MDQDQTGQDNVGQRAAEGQNPEMPDRAEEKRVDVPQNEAPVEDLAAQDDPTPTDGPTQTETRTESHTETHTETAQPDAETPDAQ